MREFKLGSILIIAAMLVIAYFVVKYIVFPLFNLALGLVAGIMSALITVIIILLIYYYLKEIFGRK
ncbi:hypothetical protein [Pedobacter sp. L105]|uniref:hypothetical protein n=1 Tax=Pedobacter sp. L105 TaxID=1641871 RepID=UPI00131B3223|nr:hypothetical protein [Pedobacter sp. L105]